MLAADKVRETYGFQGTKNNMFTNNNCYFGDFLSINFSFYLYEFGTFDNKIKCLMRKQKAFEQKQCIYLLYFFFIQAPRNE